MATDEFSDHSSSRVDSCFGDRSSVEDVDGFGCHVGRFGRDEVTVSDFARLGSSWYFTRRCEK